MANIFPNVAKDLNLSSNYNIELFIIVVITDIY